MGAEADEIRHLVEWAAVIVPLPRGASIELVDVTNLGRRLRGARLGDLVDATAWTSVDGSDWVPASLPVARDVLESYPTTTVSEGGLFAVGCARMSNDGECGGAPVALTLLRRVGLEALAARPVARVEPLDVTAADPVLRPGGQHRLGDRVPGRRGLDRWRLL